MRIIAICWLFLFGAFEVYANDKPVKMLYFVIGLQVALMIIVYIVVIVMLNT